MTMAFGRMVRAVTLGLLLPVAAFAQSGQGTQSDIDELQTQLAAVEQRVERLGQTDAARATMLSRELDLVRDDVAYLRVRLRREAGVPRDRDLGRPRPHHGARSRGVRHDAARGGAGGPRRRHRRRPGTRCPAADAPELADGGSRGSIRGDHAGRPLPGQHAARAGRIGAARRGQRRRACLAHRPARQPHAVVRPDDGGRSHLSHPRLGDAGARRARASRARSAR